MTDEEILERVLKMGLLMEAAGKLYRDFRLKAQLESEDKDEEDVSTTTMRMMGQMFPQFFSVPDDKELGERAKAAVELYKEIFGEEKDG